MAFILQIPRFPERSRFSLQHSLNETTSDTLCVRIFARDDGSTSRNPVGEILLARGKGNNSKNWREKRDDAFVRGVSRGIPASFTSEYNMIALEYSIFDCIENSTMIEIRPMRL